MNLTFDISPWLELVIKECLLDEIKLAPYKGFNKFFLDDCSNFWGHYGSSTYYFTIKSNQDSFSLYYERYEDGVLQELLEKSIDFFLEDKNLKPYKGFTAKPDTYLANQVEYSIYYEGTKLNDADEYYTYYRDSKLSLQEHFEQEVNQYIGLQ